jgi:hypothetical protein
MDVEKETLNVAGLLTNVYAPRDLRDKRSSEPIVVLFFLHGRGSSAEAVDPTPRAAFAWVAEKQASSKQSPRDFIVVTFVRWSWFFSGFRVRRPRRDGSQADLILGYRRWLFGWLTSGLAGPTEPWKEDGGWTRELGMELKGGRAQ